MTAPTIYKYAQSAQGPGVETLRTGIYNFIWSIRKIVGDTSRDVTGLFKPFKNHLKNLNKYPGVSNVTPTLDKNFVNYYIDLRDRIAPYYAKNNMVLAIQKYSNQSWYPTAVYFGEGVMRVFATLEAALRGVAVDVAATDKADTINAALTQAGNGLVQLVEQCMKATREAKSVSSNARFEQLTKIANSLM